MIQHYLVYRDATPVSWNPHAPSPDVLRDCVYFGKVLSQLENEVDSENLTVYTTWDNESVPEFGAHVVVVLIGEEWGLIPRYSRHVRLVARVMSQYPHLGIRRWWPMNRLMPFLLIKHARNWLLHFRSWLRLLYPPKTWPKRLYEDRAIVYVPWGSASLADVPMTPILQRQGNYLFSGTIVSGNESGIRQFVPAAKVYTRNMLVSTLQRLNKRYPRLADAGAIAVHDRTGTAGLSDDETYAKKMMSLKVCLAPRGSVADTWRYFEGLKSGCVVITNPLPDEWYYKDAPVIQIDDWNDLESVLLPLLANEELLTQMHEAAIRHWNEVCGEMAVARFLGFVLRSSRA